VLSDEPTRVLVQTALCLCLAGVPVASARAECVVPPYFPVKDFINPDTGVGFIHLWVPPLEFTLDRIVCLLQTLKGQHQTWTDVSVDLFSSEEAAEDFDVAPMERIPVVAVNGNVVRYKDTAELYRELRGRYVLDIDRHEHYLEITPTGFDLHGDLAAYETRIEFPVAGRIRCRVELNARCALSLDRITFPDAALRAGTSGAVTLSGQIQRDGTISDIRVVSATNQGADGRDQLVAATLGNLKTWWVEAATHQDEVRVTYSYVVDPSVPRGRVFVQFAPGNQITIRGNRNQ
jgi:hypothetical protein